MATVGAARIAHALTHAPLIHVRRPARRARTMLLALLALIGLLAAASLLWTYNALARASERVDIAWAQVANVMQRRSDLVPNLVAVTDAAAAHEAALVRELAAARAAYLAAALPGDRVASARRLDDALRAATVMIEADPRLSASRAYANLRFELAGSENRIAIERERYNAAVREYRALRRRPLARLVAAAFGLPEHPEY